MAVRLRGQTRMALGAGSDDLPDLDETRTPSEVLEVLEQALRSDTSPREKARVRVLVARHLASTWPRRAGAF